MKPSISFRLFSFLIVLVMGGLTPVLAASPESVDKIIAVVNDEIITDAELNAQMRQVERTLTEENTAIPPAAVLRHQVLDNMILMKIQLQLAKRAEIEVTDQEVNQAIAKVAENNHQTVEGLKALLVEKGLTLEGYKVQLKKQITLQKLQNQEVGNHIKINDSEVKQLVKQLKQEVNATKEYHLSDILIPLSETASVDEIIKAKATAEQVIEKLKQGQNFSEIAVSLSSGNKALQEGDMGWHVLSELPEVFAEKVKTMPVGMVSQPIQTGNGFHIIKLIDIRSVGGASPLSEEERLAQARELLIQRQFNQQVQNWLQRLRAGAYVKIEK